MKINIEPDKEKARSIINLVLQREKSLKELKNTNFPTIIGETYYEIVRELITALLLLDGKKTTGQNAHKELIESLKEYREFLDFEIIFLDDLRIKRNNSFYEGKQFPDNYINDYENSIIDIINKLKNIINKKLK